MRKTNVKHIPNDSEIGIIPVPITVQPSPSKILNHNENQQIPILDENQSIGSTLPTTDPIHTETIISEPSMKSLPPVKLMLRNQTLLSELKRLTNKVAPVPIIRTVDGFQAGSMNSTSLNTNDTLSSILQTQSSTPSTMESNSLLAQFVREKIGEPTLDTEVNINKFPPPPVSLVTPSLLTRSSPSLASTNVLKQVPNTSLKTSNSNGTFTAQNKVDPNCGRILPPVTLLQKPGIAKVHIPPPILVSKTMSTSSSSSSSALKPPPVPITRFPSANLLPQPFVKLHIQPSVSTPQIDTISNQTNETSETNPSPLKLKPISPRPIETTPLNSNVSSISNATSNWINVGKASLQSNSNSIPRSLSSGTFNSSSSFNINNAANLLKTAQQQFRTHSNSQNQLPNQFNEKQLNEQQ
jgi:hypothetical protein